MIWAFVVATILQTSPALAAGGGHGADIPWNDLIVPQTVNLFLLVLGLVLLLKNKVKLFYAQKHARFLEQKESSQRAYQEALAQKQSLEKKLSSYKSSVSTAVAQAQSDAKAVGQKLISEAQVAALRLETDSQKSAELEIYRAVLKLKSEIVEKAVDAAEAQLKQQIQETTDGTLRAAFLKRAEGLRA
jgi:F0F1-type ATP synthase membrane subunit b/b'